ncbi:MAG: p-aminobenzoyl-glutamate transport protein [Candidatus Ordinivivax streblomastigis]|uniref:p-aminobenzoyl-glutamate transport protein n=1 Tax=Candidatus Ordinivivax streblomastigis TaxID=2540710 RepID=A0A5M8NVK2_9BACT|nr:MAG: p-aminobenzoyl-glutamate transport protein [Candidatus Ordinivivax streblomastigis]
MKSSRYTLHPATLFFLLTAVIIFFSWICDIYEVGTVHPQTGEDIYVQSLLSSEGLRWLLRNVTMNFTGFAPLGMTLVAMLGIGVAQHSGFIDACIRRTRRTKGSGKRVICEIILLGILSNVVGDAGYIILLPIAAILFRSAGLHPVGGIITAYVSTACGYSANVVISTLDPIIARITQEAAIEAGLFQGGNIGALSNYSFMFVSTFLIAGIVYMLTVKKLLPALGTYEEGEQQQIVAYKQLSHKERRSLSLALTVVVIYIILILWATFSSQGVLRGVTGDLRRSPFIMGVLFIFSFGMGLAGAIYGFGSGRYRSDKDVIEGLTQPIRLLAVYIVIVFFAAQMFACLDYSHLDKCMLITASGLFSSVKLTGVGMLLLFIVFVAFVNLFMVSATGKWTFMAFIFVPVFANMGIAPDITQCAFRIGDSATNALTPFLFYMPLVFAYVRQYDNDFSYISLLRHTWKYSVYILIGWMALFVVWYSCGVAMGV